MRGSDFDFGRRKVYGSCVVTFVPLRSYDQILSSEGNPHRPPSRRVVGLEHHELDGARYDVNKLWILSVSPAQPPTRFVA